MNKSAANLRSIVANIGNWWVAVRQSFEILTESVYSSMTSERRLSGPPVYLGDEGDAGAQESINIGQPDEWTQEGGKRIVAGQILRHAAEITGADWSAVTLGQHDDPIDRGLAEAGLAIRMSKHMDCPLIYIHSVCKRWGEKRYMRRHQGAVSREYRLTHTHTVGELVDMHHQGRDNERESRLKIYTMLDDTLTDARQRLEDAPVAHRRRPA